jgi:hypothetical protein
MALLDYKITRLSHNGRHVTANVRVYRGSVTTEQDSVNGTMQDVTRYRRIAKVREFTVDYDVPRGMTRDEFATKARAYLNNKLIAYAQANGHTVINQQQDITDYEPVDNELEV